LLVNVTPQAFAARRPQLSIDISCPHSDRQQTRRTPLLLSTGEERGKGTERERDE